MTGRSVSCLVALACGVGLAAQTPDRTPTEDEARRVTERIRALEAEADRLAGESRTVLGDLRQLEIERELQETRVRDAQAAIATGRAAIDASNERLIALERERASQLPDIRAQLVDIYKRGRAGYAKLLFSSSGVREFGRATRAVAALISINEQRVLQHQRTLAALKQERAGLEEELRTLEARETEARQAAAAASRALASRSALVAQIDAQRDLNAQLAGELQVAHDRLQQQLASLESRPAVEQPVAVSLTPLRGALDWPLSGQLSGRFGQRTGRFGEPTIRNGIEIAAAEGTPVRAVQSGTVSFADAFTGFGNLVIVDHGANTYSLYGYLSSITVAEGTPVSSATEVGRVGLTPAGPAALYLEIRIDGRSVDPVQWLKPR